MNVPSVSIVIALEARPRLVVNFADEGEESRWFEWIRAHTDELDLIQRALELERQERAA